MQIEFFLKVTRESHMHTQYICIYTHLSNAFMNNWRNSVRMERDKIKAIFKTASVVKDEEKKEREKKRGKGVREREKIWFFIPSTKIIEKNVVSKFIFEFPFFLHLCV